MNLKLWPLTHIDDKCTVPDEVLAGVWAEMEKNGRVKSTFYGGSIKTCEQFISFAKSSFAFFVFVADVDKSKIVAIGWLTNFTGEIATCHFCFPGHFIPGAGEMVINYWQKFNMIHVFMGYTPESYVTVIKIIKKWGFSILGTVPNYCNMIYKGCREGAVISYRLGG